MAEEKAKDKCPICNSSCKAYPDDKRLLEFYLCPTCGKFELSSLYQNTTYNNKMNKNHLASYLCHNRFDSTDEFEYRYHTVLNQIKCDKYKEEFDNGNNTHGRPVHMDEEVIENWYPKTFAERVDHILLFLNLRIKHIGQRISLNYEETVSALFVDRYEPPIGGTEYPQEWQLRKQDDCIDETKYMLDYLVKCSYIKYDFALTVLLNNYEADDKKYVYISLTPEGYARVETLQKYTAHGRNVLVAMKFGDDTKALREAIRKGIHAADYFAVFIDEVQHNELITPELLKYIRDSKFVVVDLTHQNNGAYFEEGYAMGLGKQVIQLCKADTKLHFDIAQKNTIIWGKEDDIPDMLVNRIKATID